MKIISLLAGLALSVTVAADEVCPPIHDAAARTVTYGTTGATTLKEAVNALGPDGGVVLIPQGVYTCDAFYGVSLSNTQKITLRGVLAPDGTRPKFTCLKGDPPARVPTFVAFGWPVLAKGVASAPSPQRLMIENLEIEGYASHVKTFNVASLTIRNSKLHHATTNGIATPDLYENQTADFRFCGNEFHHSGQGNTMHNVYIHRNKTGPGSTRAWFYNNWCHDSKGSHCYKSTTNENYVVGNRFDSNTDGTATYTGTELLDIMACSTSVVANNVFNSIPNNRDMIYFTNRRDALGCDRPDFGSAQFSDSAFWTAVAAAGLDNTGANPASISNPHLFHHFVSGNTFNNLSGKPVAAIGNYGTVPSRALYPFSACSMAPAETIPPQWVERSRVWVANNTFKGMISPRYREAIPNFCNNPVPGAATPGPIIEVRSAPTLPRWFRTQ